MLPLITAQSTTRTLRSNTTSSDLLSHEIITFGNKPPLSESISKVEPYLPSTMGTDPVYLHLQQAAVNDLQPFTGDNPLMVTQFIHVIEHIGSLTDMDDSKLHTLATIKLSGAAFHWYHNNKLSLTTWASLKSNLLGRFQPSASAATSQLKTRRQQPGESLLVYYDSIIDLCQQVDTNMPLYMVVSYLLDGVRDDLKIHIKRCMKPLRTAITPAQFLQIARDEEELQNETSADTLSFFPSSPFSPHATATTHETTTQSNYQSVNRAYARPTHQSSRQPTSTRPIYHSSAQQSMQLRTSFRPCLICTGTDHRTIDCPRKHPTGCFKCGDQHHFIRYCPQVFN